MNQKLVATCETLNPEKLARFWLEYRALWHFNLPWSPPSPPVQWEP